MKTHSQHVPPGVFALLAVMVAAGGMAAAQESPPDAESGGVLRVETRLVQVDVVVRDDDGPVRDLSVEDFTLYDEGESVDIVLFEITEATAPAPQVEIAAVPGALPEDAVSNRPDSSNGQPASATILLLDRLNTEAVDQPYANDQAVEFLATLDPRHQVAIYELGTQLKLVQDYTNDPDRLTRAVTGTGTSVSSQLAASFGQGATGGFEANSNEVGLDPDLVDAQNAGTGIAERGTADLDQQTASYFINNRIRITADVLEAVANHMSRLPGRKNLVWLAGRFPFSFEPSSHFLSNEVSAPTMKQLERTARALTDANVAVYPISAVGLLAPEFNGPTAPANAGPGARRRIRFQRSVAANQSRLEVEPNSTNTMRHIAEVTGGEAFYLTNGIAAAMQSAVDDTRIVYTLGFYPDDPEQDSELHELRVDVDRDDIDVRHRRGYYGFGDPGTRQIEGIAPMEDLVTSPINATDLGLIATRQPLFGRDGEYVTRLALNLNDLDMAFRDGVWVGTVEIATLIVDGGDTNPEAQMGNLTIQLTDEEFLAASNESGYELFRFLNGDGQAGWFRVVVRETASGAAGSLWVELE